MRGGCKEGWGGEREVRVRMRRGEEGCRDRRGSGSPREIWEVESDEALRVKDGEGESCFRAGDDLRGRGPSRVCPSVVE